MVDEDQNRHEETSIQDGLRVIAEAIKTLPLSPGVYRMIAENGEVLYVGKAKSLRKRVVSYTNFAALPIRLQRMVSRTRTMEFITTHTEAEALLLESNLIKKLQPHYNILLKDNKSFPYILLRDNHDFPQILKHRGKQKKDGTYYGPFASAGDVNRTIAILQRAFLLRNCSDSYFTQRTRPCLQYHIKRCTAPCVGKVSLKQYREQVQGAEDFMNGKSRAVQERFSKAMQEASKKQDYETAALYRDRIRALTSIQAQQDINVDVGDMDIIALVQDHGRSCVQVFFFRSGRNLGNKSYFPRHDVNEEEGAVLSAFLAQFYQSKHVPKNILISHKLEDVALLEEALGDMVKSKVTIQTPQRGKRKRLIDFVSRNASEALARHLASSASKTKILEAMAELFDMEEPPSRIEVYDNSHISGTNMVGAMIVAGEEGFIKNAYRKFNIKQASASDDYAMMREVMLRRFKRMINENNSEELWPDLVLIDGGKGQLGVCKEVLEDLGILDRFTLVAIAKGPDRNAGREKFFMDNKVEFQLPINDPVLHYLQNLRDEAHSFAIGSHRKRRKKDMISSPLDGIEGIGARRKKALLLHFGSGKAVSEAGVDDLEKVEGISRNLAKKIYDFFHS
ncbi:MAG: excinuclease ABC subunit UvrC [Alphaproteobacteria bacterium]|nr:excinuclease ABC subunit UvrC [Alphaproteobacteria bacterium]